MIRIDVMKFLWLIFSPLYLFAFYTGNPLSPALLEKGLFGRSSSFLSIGVGYLADFITDKDLELVNRKEDINLQSINSFKIESQMSYASLRLVRRLEVYGYLGSSSEKIDLTPIVGDKGELKANSHFSYAIGAKAILLDFYRFVISADFNYFSLPSSSKLRKTLEGLALPDFIPIPLGSQRLQWREWQIALGLSLRLGPLSPYAGGRYSKAKIKLNIEDGPSVRFAGKNHWGVFGGLSLMLSPTFFISGELRWCDETAYSTSAVFSF